MLGMIMPLFALGIAALALFVRANLEVSCIVAVAVIGTAIFIRWCRAVSRRYDVEELQTAGATADWAETMDPLDFEENCAAALRLAGWKADTTRLSGDQGVDVLASRNGVKVVIQCKLRDRPVGNRAVQQALAGKLYVGADQGAVVTNSDYTRAARDLARRVGIRLLRFDDLRDANRIFSA